MTDETLELLEQLRNKGNRSIWDYIDEIEALNKSLSARLERVKRERDAYLDSMKGVCAMCKRREYCLLNPLPFCDSWQWCGVKER